MAACARVAVLLLIAGLTNAAPPSLSLSLASSDTLFQGDYAVLLIQVGKTNKTLTLRDSHKEKEGGRGIE